MLLQLLEHFNKLVNANFYSNKFGFFHLAFYLLIFHKFSLKYNILKTILLNFYTYLLLIKYENNDFCIVKKLQHFIILLILYLIILKYIIK